MSKNSTIMRTHRCAEISKGNLGEEVLISGWVQSRRNLGGLIFVLVRDISGLVQVTFDSSSVSDELVKKVESLRNEFVVKISGVVKKRDEEVINSNMKTGEIEIVAKDVDILSESLTPPFQVEDDINVNEELKLKYRYLDLRRPKVQKNFILRHKVYQIVRNYFSDNDFLEIETPVLTKSTPEGARDYLVPSRVHQGEFYALPQSPQLFKQLFMVSGFDRYFQIAKCFRDEDLRADRQPEFTQIDTEMSFVDVDDVIKIHEGLLKKVFKETLDIDVKTPIKRMAFDEAMNRYGSDKPDLRFDMEIQDISDIVKDCGFGVFSNAVKDGGSVKGLNVKGQVGMGRKQIDKLVEFVKSYKAKGLAWIGLNEDGTYKSSITKFLSEEEIKNILDKMECKKGDLLLFCADKNQVVLDSLGALRCELGRKLELIDKSRNEFLWVTDFPQFEYSEEQDRYVAMHHPFTMPHEEDLDLLESNPSKVRAKAYDIVLNGVELGGGSIRIHDKEIQSKMFKALGFTQEEAKEQFGFLLNAFEYGVPPHGGLAYGLDRMIMLMTNADNIRDVIAFPKTKDASCLLTDAPGGVSKKQLDELALDINSKICKK